MSQRLAEKGAARYDRIKEIVRRNDRQIKSPRVDAPEREVFDIAGFDVIKGLRIARRKKTDETDLSQREKERGHSHHSRDVDSTQPPKRGSVAGPVEGHRRARR